MRATIAAVAITAAALLSACLGQTGSAAPARLGAGPIYTSTESTARYGADPQQVVTLERTSAAGRTPLVVFVHGGSWTGGSRSIWRDEATAWAHRGWTAVAMDYRKGVLRGAPDDGRRMIADVVSVIDKYRAASYVDASRVILVGDSAGGHLATLAAYQVAWGKVAGVVGWSPMISPCRMAQGRTSGRYSDAQITLGDKAEGFWGYSCTDATGLDEAAGGRHIPTLLTTFISDFVPWLEQGYRMCQAVDVAGADCTRHVWSYSSSGHGYVNAHTTAEGQDMLAYIRSWAARVVS